MSGSSIMVFPPLTLAPLVSEVRRLLTRFVGVAWNHILREGNGLADVLAKRGLSLDLELEIFDSLPSCCSVSFLLDCASTIHCRGL